MDFVIVAIPIYLKGVKHNIHLTRGKITHPFCDIPVKVSFMYFSFLRNKYTSSAVSQTLLPKLADGLQLWCN